MANIREIRRRIRSVQSTEKITNALQLVAASKMRRAQDRALAARPYADRLQAVLSHLVAATRDAAADAPLHPLLERREIRRTAVVHITPDRGLCGGLVSNLNRHTGELVLSPQRSGDLTMIPVGKKGLDYFRRFGLAYRATFQELGDYPGLADTRPIARIAIEDFSNGDVDQVLLVYAQFINTVQQRPRTVQLLPVEPPAAEAAHQESFYIFEPDTRAVLADLLPRYVETLVYQAVLDAAASEQSARMVAMRNATDAAKDMIQELTLIYNKARQEQITSELLDIVGGVEAMAG